jgi:hypothetical protein
MEYENCVIIRGFDLFFRNASQTTLKNIAMCLGGNFNFDSASQKVTYMLTNNVLMDVNKLDGCHIVANSIGHEFNRQFSCDFVASELYLSLDTSQLKLLQNKNFTVI